jgi:hypothetical protein
MTAKNPKRPRDTNQLAKMIADIATGEATDPDHDEGKDPAAVARGRLGGAKGGAVRASKLSAQERREIAEKAAKVRWENTSSKD